MEKCPLCKHRTLDNGGLCWACLWTFDLGFPMPLTMRRILEGKRGENRKETVYDAK